MSGNIENIEALVIGSGFGGAIAALRLGEAHVDTIILERGRDWSTENGEQPFCTYREPDGRAGWFTDTEPFGTPTATPGQPAGQAFRPIDNFPGLVETTVGSNMTVWAAAGVGGGSLVYNTVFQKPTQEDFEKAFDGYRVSLSDLNPYYDLVKEKIGIKQIPCEILDTEPYRSTRVFMEQADNAGLENDLITMGLDWQDVQDELDDTKAPSAIIGEMWYGINSGAKKSLDKNYLKDAVATDHVTIKKLHEVIEISELSGGGFLVIANEFNEFGSLLGVKYFNCKYLFMGAGSVGTSKLLLKAKEMGTLPRLNDEIGKNWGHNGDTFSTRRVTDLTRSAQGGPASAAIHDPHPEDHKLNTTTLVVYPVWSEEDNQILNTLAMGISAPDELAPGEFQFNPADNSVNLYFPPDGSNDVIAAARATYVKLDAANPPKSSNPGHCHPPYSGGMRCSQNMRINVGDIEEPIPGLQVVSGITPHPLGGCVMEKACDTHGRVDGIGSFGQYYNLLPGLMKRSLRPHE